MSRFHPTGRSGYGWKGTVVSIGPVSTNPCHVSILIILLTYFWQLLIISNIIKTCFVPVQFDLWLCILGLFCSRLPCVHTQSASFAWQTLSQRRVTLQTLSSQYEPEDYWRSTLQGCSATRLSTILPCFPPVVQHKEFPCCHQQDLWLTTAVTAAARVSHFSIFIKILTLDCERSNTDHDFQDLFNSSSIYFHFLIQGEPRPNHDLNYQKDMNQHQLHSIFLPLIILFLMCLFY